MCDDPCLHIVCVQNLCQVTRLLTSRHYLMRVKENLLSWLMKPCRIWPPGCPSNFISSLWAIVHAIPITLASWLILKHSWALALAVLSAPWAHPLGICQSHCLILFQALLKDLLLSILKPAHPVQNHQPPAILVFLMLLTTLNYFHIFISLKFLEWDLEPSAGLPAHTRPPMMSKPLSS